VGVVWWGRGGGGGGGGGRGGGGRFCVPKRRSSRDSYCKRDSVENQQKFRTGILVFWERLIRDYGKDGAGNAGGGWGERARTLEQERTEHVASGSGTQRRRQIKTGETADLGG